MNIIEHITNEQRTDQKIYFIYGDEEISENILSDLLDAIDDDELKFVPETLIKNYGDDDKSGHQDFPLYNIKDSKYLVVTGVTQYNNFDLWFIKSLVGGDGYFCNFCKGIVYTHPPKLIIFCDNDPTDYLGGLEEHDRAFLRRTKVVENGILL